MATFKATPVPEAAGLKDVGTLAELLRAMAENIEILTGQRGPGRAVTNDTIGIDVGARWVTLRQINTPSGGVTTAAGGVPTYVDFVRMANDLQQLVSDVTTLQSVLVLLITNLRK